MDRPILFSGPMVRALLSGAKTQTRRLVKWRAPAPGLNLGFSGLGVSQTTAGWVLESASRTSSEWRCEPTPCPYGQPGDRLWVRESFAFTDAHEPEYMGSVDYRADGACIAVDHGPVLVNGVDHHCDKRPFEGPWKPSIHMPRWASRITLEITGVRVERLQDISEADAIDEGVSPDASGRPDDDAEAFWRIGAVRGDSFPIARYAALWESINGHGSWDANPFVWVVEFKRIKP